ncbi:hypothetical protein [Nostoc sp.]|uniref:hypothetical protein n=1 Tax=Nostoc sp. TaxID=1180 RepID=UPI002FF9777D
MQFYVAYLQAHQATLIATYQIQKFTGGSGIASLYSQATSPKNINHLANPDYVAAATSMLEANTHERLTLEELAACVGLSPQEMTAIISKQ